MKFNFLNKRGELTTQQIVILIVLITSFAVILFFLWRLNPGELSQKEVCHNSVVTASKASLFSGALDCSTEYVCISAGGECDGFTHTRKVEISFTNNPAKNKQILMDAIANEMVDCWWMYGEGKLDYLNKGALSKKHCALCSVIAFDKKAGSVLPITYGVFYNYLQNKNYPGHGNYLNYLYGTSNSGKIINSFGKLFGQTGTFVNLGFEANKQYSIMTGMMKTGVLNYFLFPANIVMNKNNKNENDILPLLIFEANTKNYDAVNCDEFISKV